MLSVNITSAGRRFNEVTDYAKKVEGVKQDGQARALSRRAKSFGNFKGSYARGSGRPTLVAKQIQFAMPVSISNYSTTPYNNFLVDQTVRHVVGSRPSSGHT